MSRSRWTHFGWKSKRLHVSRRIVCRHPGLKVLHELRSRMVVPDTLRATLRRHAVRIIRRELNLGEDIGRLSLHLCWVPEVELVTRVHHMGAVARGEIRLDCVRETHSH